MNTKILTVSGSVSQQAKNLVVILGATLLLCLSVLISIPLPFTPVPVVFSCQMILLISAALGKRGFAATLSYLGLGAMGLPVFAGCSGGFLHFFGPTGGYLVGFALASYIVATLSERMVEKTPLKMFGTLALGNSLVFAFGIAHLALFVGFDRSLALGLYPFMGVDLLKLVMTHQALKLFKN